MGILKFSISLNDYFNMEFVCVLMKNSYLIDFYHLLTAVIAMLQGCQLLLINDSIG